LNKRLLFLYLVGKVQ